MVNRTVLREIKSSDGKGKSSLTAVIGAIIRDAQTRVDARRCASSVVDSFENGDGAIPVLQSSFPAQTKQLLSQTILPFFDYYAQGNDNIDMNELKLLLKDLNEDTSRVEAWMQRMDADRSGVIERNEFMNAMLTFITYKVAEPTDGQEEAIYEETSVSERESVEEEELPEFEGCSSPEEFQSAVKLRAAKLMSVGMALILVFSDPMVDVMANVGDRLTIPPFYVAFVLAPLASNASELIASLNYASKKTRQTITISLAALEGAACMNNTFCLAIFMGLIFFKGLAWKFSAEAKVVVSVHLTSWHAFCKCDVLLNWMSVCMRSRRMPPAAITC